MVDASQSWVCGNCRSINPARSGQCYSCRSPRSLAVDIANVSSSSQSKPIRDDAEPAEHASFARGAGARYVPTDRLAWALRLGVLVVTIATLTRIGFDVWVLGVAPATQLGEPIPTVDVVLIGLVGLAWLGSFVTWGAWLRGVVANVPALGGGWPGTTPTAAFLSAAIPGSNLIWGTAVMRDVISRLTRPQPARLGLLTMWWIATIVAALPWIGRIPGQTAVVRIGYRLVAASLAGIASAITGATVTESQMVEVLAGVFLILAAALAIWLVDQIEELQESRRAQLGLPTQAEPRADAG